MRVRMPPSVFGPAPLVDAAASEAGEEASAAAAPSASAAIVTPSVLTDSRTVEPAA